MPRQRDRRQRRHHRLRQRRGASRSPTPPPTPPARRARRTKSINVDNVTPSVSLSAPADTASTSGTQDVTATATAGPSGIAAISCSVDGGATQTYPGATRAGPGVGIGAHQVAVLCPQQRGERQRRRPPRSPTATLDLSIRQPTASAITFARIADALQCHTATERRQGGGPACTPSAGTASASGCADRPGRVRRRVRKCHARTVVRTVGWSSSATASRCCATASPSMSSGACAEWSCPTPSTSRRAVSATASSTTVNGFVGLADGTALAGQPVDVYSSPNDNAPRFQLMRMVTTNADGEWTAKVGAGPVAADRGGLSRQRHHRAGDSSTVKLIVPAQDRHVDLTAGGALVGEDHHHRAAGRRLGTARRRRAAAAGSLPRWSDSPRAVSHQPPWPVQVPLDLPVRARRGAVPLRGRDHVHRIGLPVGGRDEQPRGGHLRAPDATDPPTSAAPPGDRTMSARARGEHDWPRATAWRPVRPAVRRPSATSAPSERELARRADRRGRWRSPAALGSAPAGCGSRSPCSRSPPSPSASSAPGRPSAPATRAASRGHAARVV